MTNYPCDNCPASTSSPVTLNYQGITWRLCGSPKCTNKLINNYVPGSKFSSFLDSIAPCYPGAPIPGDTYE